MCNHFSNYFSLREQFAVEGSVELNPLHGSDDPEIAAKEVEYFFPVEHTLCAIKPSHFSERGKGERLQSFSRALRVYFTNLLSK